MSERTLDRLIRTGLKALAVGIAVVAVLYFLERRETTPSLIERQISAAEDAVRAAPTETGLRLRLANIYRAADRPDDALEQYDAVLEVEKGQATALIGRGEVLAESDDFGGATRAFKQVIGTTKGEEFASINPQLESAYYGLGTVLLEQGKAKEAARTARKATEIEPTDADAWYVVGAAYNKAGEHELAVKALRQAVLFVPIEWCDPYKELSKAYKAQGRKAFAEYATAMIELCEEDAESAAERLKPLVSGPVKIEAMTGLGMAGEALSQRENAKRWYRKVVAVDSENFNARAGLARLGAPIGGE